MELPAPTPTLADLLNETPTFNEVKISSRMTQLEHENAALKRQIKVFSERLQFPVVVAAPVHYPRNKDQEKRKHRRMISRHANEKLEEALLRSSEMMSVVQARDATIASLKQKISETYSCRICENAFNTSKNIPRILKCGHTICECCAYILHQQMRCASVKCPKCTQVTSVTVIVTLTKNFSLIPSD